MNADLFDKDYKIISVLGLIFILVGAVFNEWTIALFLTADGVINSIPKRIAIWTFDLLFIFAGFATLKYKRSIKARGREIIFLIIIFISFLFILEGGMRGFFYIKNMIVGVDMSFEDYLGWRTEENVSWKKIRKDYGEIVFSTSKYGFRVFGDINTSKIKIFVIGDSYTMASTVSDGYTYYDYLRKNHDNIEIFTYGAGGYGSLQEHMILDKYFDIIKPDVILWQFTNNDLVNNSYNLESRSLIANNHTTRPYYNYKTKEIIWLYPRQTFGWIYRIAQHSYLLKFLYIRLDIAESDTIGSIEKHLTENDPLAKEAIETTSAILGLVRKRAGSIPIVAFSVDSAKYQDYLPWSHSVYRNVSQKNSIFYIDYLPKILAEAQASGIAIDSPINTHWNVNGHSIAGETILNYLIKNKLLIKKQN